MLLIILDKDWSSRIILKGLSLFVGVEIGFPKAVGRKCNQNKAILFENHQRNRNRQALLWSKVVRYAGMFLINFLRLFFVEKVHFVDSFRKIWKKLVLIVKISHFLVCVAENCHFWCLMLERFKESSSPAFYCQDHNLWACPTIWIFRFTQQHNFSIFFG